MTKNSQQPKDRRLLFILLFCAVSGAILNGSAGWAQTIQCQQSDAPTAQCISKPAVVGAIEGGVMGVLAGTGAALGAVGRRFL
jgi:hypothetical protein